MPVDPSIPLAAGQPSGPFGPDLKQIITLQNLAQQMQARQMVMQQEQQGQNALKQIYGNPQNIDPSGYPTPNALRQLMTTSPQVGLELLPQLNRARETDLRAKLIGEKVSDEHRNWAIDEVAVPSVAKYREVLQQTGNQETAQNEAQKVYSERLESVKADGRLGTNAARLSPTFNYSNANANIMGRKGLEKAAEMDAEANKPITPYQKAKLAIDEGKAEAGLAKGDLYEGKVGDKDVTVQRGPGGRGFVDTNTGEPVEDIKGLHKVGTKGEGATADLSPSKEIAVVDKDGNVVDRFAARESKTGPGWVRSDSGEPVKIPPGGKVDVGQAAGAVIGSRENVYIGRILEGGITATTDLENISKMPITVTSGVFGGRKQGPGLIDATKEVLANQLTSQDVQIYNSANTGIQRALAVIESSGLAPSGAFTEQFQGLTLKEGDTQLARLYKMANARQVVENGMQVIKANPRVAPEQKKLADQFLDRVKTAIPWTTSDVIKLQTSDKPDATLHNLGVARTGSGAATSAPTPAGQAAVKGGSLDATPEQYEKLPPGAAYTVPGDPKVRYKQ